MAEVVERYSTAIDIYRDHRPAAKLSTAYVCFKVILLVANLVFMIFGCILIGVGSYALNSTANQLVGQTLPSGVIVMGVFILVLAAIGACSAWKESIIGLAVYLTLLLIICIILFSIGVAIVVKKNQAGEYIQSAWYRGPADVKQSIQQNLNCCGLTNWNDSAVLPCPTASSNTTGCYPQLLNAFNTAYANAGGVGIGFSISMGLGIIIVICLLQGIKRKQTQETAEKLRAVNNANDLDGAASMFDRDGYNPEEHDPTAVAQQAQQRRK